MEVIATAKDQILEELGRILASPGFSRNERLSAFLRYVVEQKLQGKTEGIKGKTEGIKEAVIGSEVFGRKPGYDLRKDPVVRMEAAKLRARLAEYYAGAGVTDPVRIEIPKGRYIPQWQAGRRTYRQWRWRAASVTLAALLGLLAVLDFPGLWEKLAGRTNTPPIHSLAVLPFENLSHDSAQDYFADGMTEALMTDLGKMGALRVISRTSVMRYKNTHKTLPEIGRELNADAVIEGAVLRSADRVRITAQLIHTATDRHLWAESYEGDVRDILILQGEVARAIANEIKIKLSPQERTYLANRRPVNTEAHEAYLRGRYEWNKWTKAGLEKSIEYFQQSLHKDPAYAQAWAGLSDAYGLLGTFGIWSAPDAFPKARAAALKALELDETLSEAHVSATSGHFFTPGWSWLATEKELQRAIALDSNNAMAHQWYGYHLSAMGRFDEAIAEMRRALELDPLSPNKQNSLAATLYRAGRYDEALQHDRLVPDPDENSERRHRRMANVYEQMGMQKEAVTELLAALRWGGKKDLASVVGQKYLASGYLEAKKTFLWGDVKENQRLSRPALDIAADYALLGEKDNALDWLDKAFHEANFGLMYLKVDDQFETLRSEPRFQDMLRRIGLSP